MPLIVTGTIGIDTIHAPTGKAEAVLGGSATYFAAAASFFGPVRMVAAVGHDFNEGHRATLARFPSVSIEGIDARPHPSRTFAWGGKYHEDMNIRETLFTELGVLAEHPPTAPQKYRDSRYVFLANTHPAVQRGLLESFPSRALAVADTMDLWIDTAKAELTALLKHVDGLVLNDQEARLLTGRRHPIDAGRAILDMGPGFAVIKKGEHGCVMVHRDAERAIGVPAVSMPAYPTTKVVDPTGAGDSFAGGMFGFVAAEHQASKFGAEKVPFETLHRGLARGTVVASFTIESFSLDRLAKLTRREIDERLAAYARSLQSQ